MSAQTSEAIDIFESNTTYEELLLGLGENLANDLCFEEDLTREQKIASGSSWWSENGPIIKNTVCKVACDKESSSAIIKDVIQIVFALVGAKYGMAVASYASALAARRLIDGWCKEE